MSNIRDDAQELGIQNMDTHRLKALTQSWILIDWKLKQNAWEQEALRLRVQETETAVHLKIRCALRHALCPC